MIIVMDSLRDTIGKNFNKFMEMNPELTAPRIAEAAGVTRGMVYKWVDMTNIPDPDKIEKLATLFRVSVLDFYRREGDDVPTIQPSRALKKYLVIPDEIVEALCHFDSESKIWANIMETINLQKRIDDLAKTQREKGTSDS